MQKVAQHVSNSLSVSADHANYAATFSFILHLLQLPKRLCRVNTETHRENSSQTQHLSTLRGFDLTGN